MSLMRAFTVMLGDVKAADASARQVTGILQWRDYVHEAVRRGEGLPCSPGRAVHMPSSSTHARWVMAAEAILDDLREQANDADVLYEEAMAAANAADGEAAAAESEAASAEASAAAEQAAAAACASERDFGGAAAHTAAAAGYSAAAAAAHARAEDARARAAAARELAEKAMAWGIAARDAHTFGERLVADENSIAIPVGEALAAAGGVTEVYGTKHALSADTGSGGSRQMALRGGAR
jgi:hypothetical protein